MQVAVTWDRYAHETTLTDFLNKLVEDGNIIDSVIPAIHNPFGDKDEGYKLDAAVILYRTPRQSLKIS